MASKALKLLPNFITSLRIAAAAAIWLGVGGMLGDEQGRWLLRGLLVAAAVTDLIDGLAARWLQAYGRFGYILDPIADKLFFNTMFLYLAFDSTSPFPVRLPGWFAVAILARDISWLTGGLTIRFLTGRLDIPPSLPGKLANWAAAGALFAVLLTPEVLSVEWGHNLSWRLAVLCVALSGAALVGYGYKVFRMKRGNGHVEAPRPPAK
jgi:phosphatidylglycerophosphate synthase